MSTHTAGMRIDIETECWAEPGQGQSLDRLAEQMLAIGNTVLERDDDGNRLLLCRTKDVAMSLVPPVMCLVEGCTNIAPRSLVIPADYELHLPPEWAALVTGRACPVCDEHMATIGVEEEVA